MEQLLKNIQEALLIRGIKAEPIKIIKNGDPYIGFRIDTGTIMSPIIYYSQQESIESFAKRTNEAMAQKMEIDLEYLKDKEYVRKNLYVSVQKARNNEHQHYIKRNVLNLEAFICIKVGSSDDEELRSIKATDEILAMCGFNADNAWIQATSNMVASFSVRSMADVLRLPGDLLVANFFVITAGDRVYGSSALLFPEIFRNFCLKMDINAILILPSNTHEILIIPENVDVDYDEFIAMMKEVNRNSIDSLIQLDPVVYRYDIKSDNIQIVAGQT